MTVIQSQPSGYFNSDGTFQQFEETNQNPLDTCRYHSDLLSWESEKNCDWLTDKIVVLKYAWLTDKIVLKCANGGLSYYGILQVWTVTFVVKIIDPLGINSYSKSLLRICRPYVCINNSHLLRGFANASACECMVCSEWIIFEYRQNMCNDIQCISKMIHSNLSIKIQN